MLAPLGAKILHEGVFDKTRTFEGQTLGKATFWHTRNIQRASGHQRTCRASVCRCTATTISRACPPCSMARSGKSWSGARRRPRVIGPTPTTCSTSSAAGTYAEAPPVLAVRQLGQGADRLLSALPAVHGHQPPQPALGRHRGMQRRPGRRAAEPQHEDADERLPLAGRAGRRLAGFRNLCPGAYQPVQFPAKVELGPSPLATAVAPTGIRGIFGAHSAYSDGSGTVADYVQAAKAAGLSFLVFADPLEKLTEGNLGKTEGRLRRRLPSRATSTPVPASSSPTASATAGPFGAKRSSGPRRPSAAASSRTSSGTASGSTITASTLLPAISRQRTVGLQAVAPATARTPRTSGGSSITCRWCTKRTG